MNARHERTLLLIGEEGLDKLKKARVAVFGLGGVGGVAAEMLARAGVGTLHLVDFATVSESNLNRQLIALGSTLGMKKTDVIASRLSDVNPDTKVVAHEMFFAEDTKESFDFGEFDLVLDCIDSLHPKVRLIKAALDNKTPIIVSTGAGGRTDPSGVYVADLFSSRGCPLARHLKKRLRHIDVNCPIPAVMSPVPPKPASPVEVDPQDFHRGRARNPVGSISFVPAVFGCVMASFAARMILEEEDAGKWYGPQK